MIIDTKHIQFFGWSDNQSKGFWFRFFGYGLLVNNTKPLRYMKCIKIGDYKIALLKPIRYSTDDHRTNNEKNDIGGNNGS